MAIVKETVLNIPKSGSPDVVGYVLYIAPAPVAVDYSSPKFPLGLPPSDENGVLHVNMSALPGMTTTDGIYNIGVTTVDDGENESSMSLLDNVPLDFAAPDAPGPLSITRV